MQRVRIQQATNPEQAEGSPGGPAPNIQRVKPYNMEIDTVRANLQVPQTFATQSKYRIPGDQGAVLE